MTMLYLWNKSKIEGEARCKYINSKNLVVCLKNYTFHAVIDESM